MEEMHAVRGMGERICLRSRDAGVTDTCSAAGVFHPFWKSTCWKVDIASKCGNAAQTDVESAADLRARLAAK
jgi:hypothetical protein